MIFIPEELVNIILSFLKCNNSKCDNLQTYDKSEGFLVDSKEIYDKSGYVYCYECLNCYEYCESCECHIMDPEHFLDYEYCDICEKNICTENENSYCGCPSICYECAKYSDRHKC